MSTTSHCAFVDYEKTFYSIEFEPIFHALKNHGVDKAYLDIIKHLYHETTSVIHVYTHIVRNSGCREV